MSAKALGESVYSVEKNSSGSTAAYKLVTAKDAKLKESWYQDVIFNNPELVLGVCRRAGLVAEGETWLAWKTEFALPTGSIDVLLLSSRGRIGIVETKLAFNPERRREVVAQILDYALAFEELPLDALPPIPTGGDFVAPERHEIAETLRSGNFLLVIAGDQLDPRAIRLSEALLAGHLTSEWDLAMVDLNLYSNTANGTHVLVPELRGTMIHESRQVVRVKVEGTQLKGVSVERVSDPERTGRTLWTPETFSNALATAHVPAEFRLLVEKLRDIAARHSRATISYGTGATGSITLRHDDSSILSFWLDGRAETKPREYLERALGSAAATQYQAAVAGLWGKEFADGWKRPTVDQVRKHGSAILDAIEVAIGSAEQSENRS